MTPEHCFYCVHTDFAYKNDLSPGQLLLLCERHRENNARFDRVFGRMIPTPTTREPRWRYFDHKGWRYGWTTERMDHGGFEAFVYRPVGKDGLELVKTVTFAKRSSAKAKARWWWERARQQASGRLPARLLG